ncbi:MAG: phytoene desaturase family protein [Bryobacteraceae bacterium]
MRAVIVGAGLGGLALALRLRAAGWDVTVCEHGPAPGGKMNRFRAGGFTFDTGPTLLTMPHVLERLFTFLGERMEDHLSLECLDPHAEYVFADGSRLRVPARASEWLEMVGEFAPRDVAGVRKIHEIGERIFRLSEGTFFRNHPLLPVGPPPLAAFRHLPLRHAWGNYARTVARLVSDPRLRFIYNRYPTYVGSSPYQTPATMLVIPYIEHRFGAWRVRGGMYRIVETLERLATGLGVEIRTGATAVRLLLEGGRAAGVELQSGERIAAPLVVFNGDSDRLPVLLGRPARPRPDSRSLSGVILLAGIRRITQLETHTVLFSESYEKEFGELFEHCVFPSDPTVYIYAPRDPELAPEGGQSLFLMANAPGDGRSRWDETAAAEAVRRMLERLRRSGLADVANEAGIFHVRHPGLFEQRFLAPGGAIYGQNSHGWRRAFFRPPNRVAGVPGLYCTGGSYHPGGGVPMVLMSAEITAALIARHRSAIS